MKEKIFNSVPIGVVADIFQKARSMGKATRLGMSGWNVRNIKPDSADHDLPMAVNWAECCILWLKHAVWKIRSSVVKIGLSSLGTRVQGRRLRSYVSDLGFQMCGLPYTMPAEQ